MIGAKWFSDGMPHPREDNMTGSLQFGWEGWRFFEHVQLSQPYMALHGKWRKTSPDTPPS
jgi:hypothetical protein